jgi:hypothetical protein
LGKKRWRLLRDQITSVSLKNNRQREKIRKQNYL